MTQRLTRKARAAATRRGNGANRASLAAPDGLTTVNGRATAAPDLFARFALAAARWSGRPVTFLAAVLLILVWAMSGPLFHYSDTWQLVVNTATTIITFLMVFLIQNTQNRDAMALQIKLADLIIAMRGADNRLAAAEDLSDVELEALHQEYRKRAEATLGTIERRRASRAEA